MTINWNAYSVKGLYDELIRARGRPREFAKPLTQFLASLNQNELDAIGAAAQLSIKEMGVTFRVYSEDEGSIDREWPLDIIPRVMSASEWSSIQQGLVQRAQALNLFIDDIYHDQKIVADKVFPAEILAKSKNFRPQCVGISPPLGTWAHICGSDLVRDRDGTMYVLEDNLRVPSGVSYMLENRQVMKRVFPELFEHYPILPIDDYTSQLFDTLAAVSPRPGDRPEVVVLTPGIYNSAYFEHSYLAQQMGCELVEGRDLVVGDDDCVYMRTIDGLARVDTVYRRIDDTFLDPDAFDSESMLGVPGLMRAWKAG
ncbi:MAG: circularly permuted type 2 ATP-grasp protein, partial [Gammaproteobacteria bacterium]|nr:circularly permuted type 2 ATP-grasp protein [Gammaproteobacteria bacterium]